MFDQQDELQERRLQHQLEMQSMQIEHVFNQHQMEAHIAGGTVKPRSISFHLQTQLATGLERLKTLTDDLMQTLGVPVSLSREDGEFRLDVSQRSEPPVSLLDLMSLLPEMAPTTAVLGLAEDGRPVLLDFTEQGMTHILISGMSDAGKSALLRSLAISLALLNRQSRVQFVVIDGSTNNGRGDANLQALNFLPHMLTNVMCHAEDIQETMAFLTDEVAYRLEYEVVAPTIVILIDEVTSLLEKGDGLIRDAIRFLAQRGADVGVHLVMSTPRPQSTALDNLLKANISVQIVGQLADSEQAKAVTGLQSSQAEYLLGQGDFLAVAGEFLTHFQAAYIGDYDLHMTLQELHRKRPPTLLAQSVEELDSISLPNLADNDEVNESQQHFFYNGDTISLHAEAPPKTTLSFELEEIFVEEIKEETATSYVPQPVIKLVPKEVEELEVIEQVEGDWQEMEEEVEEETADAIVTIEIEDEDDEAEEVNVPPSLPEIKKSISEKPKKPFLPRLVLPDPQSEIKPKPKITLPIEAAKLEDEPLEVEESEQAVEAEETEEVEAEYESFEDDWLPFDDD